MLDTLRWLVHESQTWVEITNLIIPGANDSPAEIERMCRWIAAELRPDVPLHFSAFHPDHKLTDRGPTPPIVLQQAHDIARAAGLHYVYTGNVYDPEHQHTVLSRLRPSGHPPRRLHDFRVRDQGRPLRPLPNPDRRPLRRRGGDLGRPADARQNSRLKQGACYG